jgi:hypothetical protein
MKTNLLSILVGLVLLPGASQAAVVVSESFNANSGGVPAGWADIGFDNRPGTSIIESGSTVTITDLVDQGPKLMQGPTFASLSYFSLTLEIASATPVSGSQPSALMVFGNPFGGNALVVEFDTAIKTFRAFVVNNGAPVGGDYPMTVGPHTPSYSNGTITINVVADADSFSISSPTNSYSSGDMLFSASGAPGVDSIDDFGAANMTLFLGVSTDGNVLSGTPGSVAFDSVQISTIVPVPEPTSLGLLVLGGLTLSCKRRRSFRN